jgi:predicted aminopeptidase
VPGDAGFNESFATTVEIEGLRRWQTAIGDPAAFETYQRERRRQREFVDLMMRYRERLAALYDSALDDAAKRVEKQRILDELQAEYPRLTADWGGDERYAGWFAHRLNNAHLASIELYHEFVPAFQALLAASGSDLLAFYRAAQTLGELPEAERHARLTALNDESASSVGAKN